MYTADEGQWSYKRGESMNVKAGLIAALMAFFVCSMLTYCAIFIDGWTHIHALPFNDWGWLHSGPMVLSSVRAGFLLFLVLVGLLAGFAVFGLFFLLGRMKS